MMVTTEFERGRDVKISALPITELQLDPKGIYCNPEIPFEAALERGREDVAELITQHDVDIDTLKTVVELYWKRVISLPIYNSVYHFYTKVGRDGKLALDTWETIKKCMSLFAGWNLIQGPGFLSMTDKLDLEGWHGLMIQTKEWSDFQRKLGATIEHATTLAPTGTAVFLTIGLYEHVFGTPIPEVWCDGPGIIIEGWCSSD